MLRSKVRAALLAAVAVLYVVSVPWYRPSDAPLRLWLGMPDWVATALLAYLAIAVCNATAWLLTDIPEREDERS